MQLLPLGRRRPMVSTKLVVAVMVTVCSLKVAGCRGEAAPSNRLPPRQGAASSVFPGKNASQTSPAGKPARPLHSDTPHRDTPHRDTPREAFLSFYNNPQHGISFRYPRNYSL